MEISFLGEALKLDSADDGKLFFFSFFLNLNGSSSFSTKLYEAVNIEHFVIIYSVYFLFSSNT